MSTYGGDSLLDIFLLLFLFLHLNYKNHLCYSRVVVEKKKNNQKNSETSWVMMVTNFNM